MILQVDVTQVEALSKPRASGDDPPPMPYALVGFP